LKIFNFNKIGHYFFVVVAYGSIASRKASPRALNPKTEIKIAKTGLKTHG